MTFEVVQSIPSPFRLHLFEALWKELRKRGIDFHVNFMAEGFSWRPDVWRHPKIGFPHTYWRNVSHEKCPFNVGMITYLKTRKPDILLVGSVYDSLTSVVVAMIKPSKLACAWLEGQTKTPGRVSGLVGWFKRYVISQYKYVAVPGLDGAQYIAMHQRLTKRKMPDPVILPNLIDETRFKPRSRWPQEDVESLRRRLLGDSLQRLCLIPARLEAVKGLVEFIDLLEAQMIRGWRILIIGQGSRKNEILAKIEERAVSRNVLVMDYISYDEMPLYYASADLFLLPSLHDPNPLSVVEALHSGLPIALSDQSGNVEEAVSEGENGWRLPVRERENFKNIVETIFGASDSKLREMGHHSLKVNAKFWNTENQVEEFVTYLINHL